VNVLRIGYQLQGAVRRPEASLKLSSWGTAVVLRPPNRGLRILGSSDCSNQSRSQCCVEATYKFVHIHPGCLDELI